MNNIILNKFKNKNNNTSYKPISLYLVALLFACYLHATWLIITFSILIFLCFCNKVMLLKK